MKTIKKYLLTSFFILLSALSGILFSTKAAAETKYSTHLIPDKTYYFDLDKDGKKEKIKYVVTEEDLEDSLTRSCIHTLFINGNEAYKKTTDTLKCGIEICDVDTKDKYLDIFVTAPYTIDCINEKGYSYFLRYKNDKLKIKQNLISIYEKENLKEPFSLHCDSAYISGTNETQGTIATDGKGNITLMLCFYSKSAEYIHACAKLELKNDKFIDTSNNLFDITDSSIFYTTIRSNFKVYKDANSKKIAFTAKKNSSIHAKQICFKNGKGYINLAVDDKTGWISFDQFKFNKYIEWTGALHI